MKLPTAHRAALIWLVLAAILLGRLGDAHLHVCFDGQEPPATIHLADDANHDDAHHDLDSEHVDQDVELSDVGIVKKSVGDSGLSIVPTAVLLFLLPLALRGRWDEVLIDRILPSPPFFLRPPLRGPPR